MQRLATPLPFGLVLMMVLQSLEHVNGLLAALRHVGKLFAFDDQQVLLFVLERIRNRLQMRSSRVRLLLSFLSDTAYLMSRHA